ncbi:ATP-binding protein [Streptomyces longispororuber]|uniref:ATP-binding protein n=1 Tax=Streptomyces longispororuber TaxID=68230 RepID=UPI0034051B60
MTPVTDVTASAAQAPPTLRTFEVAFLRDPVRVSPMRHITAAYLSTWGLCSPLTDNVILAVSELTGNAVQHGQGEEATLRVRCTADLLVIEVDDGNPAPAETRYAGAGDENGRGLMLLGVLARNWGVTNGGATTWCEFRLGGEPS